MHNNACMGLPGSHMHNMQALCLTLTDSMGCLEWKSLMLFQSAVSREFSCVVGGGDCNSYALDLAAALQEHHFKNTHFY